MVGIKDVAKHAGVAVGTVSRVINNNTTVNPEIRERVLKSIKELNYVPNEVARSFKLRTTKMVALLLPSIWNPFFSELAYYIEDELDKSGYKLLLCNSGGRPEKEQYYLDMLKQNKVAGVLGITYNPYETEIEPEIPFVSIDRRFSENVICVTSDNFKGGSMAAKELIKKGCKKIAFIGDYTKIKSEVSNRKVGFIEEAEKEGVEYVIFEELDPIKDNEAFVRKFIEMYPDVDGVFAITDMLAATYIKIAKENNISVPEDVKVIGYDGIQNTDLFHPILSTIRQPVKEMAMKSVELLIKRINNKKIDILTVSIDVEFRQGETT